MRIKTILAAIVLLGVGVQAQAGDPAVNATSVSGLSNGSGFFQGDYTYKRTFASNDPNYPNRTDYKTSRLQVAKTGKPWKWFKKSPIEVAALAAVAAAGYAIDELTNQISTPPTSTTYDDTYWYFRVNGVDLGPLANDPAAAKQYYCDTVVGSYQYCSTAGGMSVYGDYQEGSFWYRNSSGTTVYKNLQGYQCGTSETYTCDVVQEGTELPDAEAWALLDPLVDQATLEYWAKDTYDLPRLYPEVAAEQNLLADDVIGAADAAATLTDPLDALDSAPIASTTPEYSAELLKRINDSLQVDAGVPSEPTVDFSIPELPETDWAIESEHTGFWNFLRTTFPFSLATAPLAAIAAPTPNAPEFCYTAVGLTDCASMSMWDGLFSAIRFAEGLLMIFGFYLVMQRAIMRFAS